MTARSTRLEPAIYERELAAVLVVMLGRESSPEGAAELLAEQLAAHRARIAALYLSVFPIGTEPENELRATLAFARDLVSPACPGLADDPRGQLIARLLRERFELAQTCEQLRAELNAARER